LQLNFYVWVLVGAIVGGAASTCIGIRDWQRFTRNVAVGIAGFVLGGSLVSELSGSSSFQGGEFGLEGMLVSLLGTTLLLAAMHLISNSETRLAKASHIASSGKGEHQPVADNESEGGRQQNRRVEVIIMNPAPAVAST
jgi:uncharacterized membrane protein YeaQ/YmgE (transglycosylase-associated protein family)